MTDNTAPTIEPSGDAAEVEAHSCVLDLQGLGKDMDKPHSSACISIQSIAEAL